MNLLADVSLAPKGGFFKGIGILGNPGENSISLFSSIISTVIGTMTMVAIIWFIFTFLTGAVGIISSGGDKQALESARKKITTGAVGLIVVLLALVIVNLVGKVLGIDNILNLGELFRELIS